MSALDLKVAAANAVGALARGVGRGGGTSLPGKVLVRLAPDAIGRLAARLDLGSAVVSATNGKTTTAAMVAAILAEEGRAVVHNRAGANMAGGIAAALAAARPRPGAGELGLFEVDEFWLGDVVTQLRPRALLLGNLFRDQLDRYGELDAIADRWRALVADPRTRATRLVLCADDATVAELARAAAPAGSAAARADAPPTAAALSDDAPLHFGVEDDAIAQAGRPHASEAKHCRRCGHPYRYAVSHVGHLGRYACPSCGARRPTPAVAAEAVDLRGLRAAAFTLRTPVGTARVTLPLPGLYNVYNALGAAALALRLGASLPSVVAGLEGVAPAFGRAETVELAGRPASILLVKNPAGANEVLRTLALEGDGLELLGVLNDRVADGRDVSWIWDADWERLAPHVGRAVCAGTRAAELALRLAYAGVPRERLEVVPELEPALDRAIAARPAPVPLAVLPTYTALLELRGALERRGVGERFWS